MDDERMNAQVVLPVTIKVLSRAEMDFDEDTPRWIIWGLENVVVRKRRDQNQHFLTILR